MNLYAIANEYQALLSQTFDPETGEVNEGAMIALDTIKDDIKDKGIAIASYIKNLEAERKAIEEAKKAMAEREARLDRRADYLAEYLKSNMERCGISVISSPYFEVKIKKNPVSVHIFDESALPSEYVREKVVTTRSPDKALIKEALQAGVELQCATLKQTTRLEIR